MVILETTELRPRNFTITSKRRILNILINTQLNVKLKLQAARYEVFPI
jgi:hypothetical protein